MEKILIKNEEFVCGSDPKTFLWLNNKLKEAGFKKVASRQPDNSFQINKKLTLLIHPTNQSITYIGSAHGKKFLEKGILDAEMIGYFCGQTCVLYNQMADKYPDAVKLETLVPDYIFAYYVPSRNLVVTALPLCYMGGGLLTKVWGFFEKWLKEIKVQGIEIDEEKLSFDQFKAVYVNKLQGIKSEITSINNRLKEYETSISNNIIDRISKEMSYETIKKFVDSNSFDLVKKQIENIKKFPFVKDARISDSSIIVEIKDVKINYQGVTYEMGNYTVNINLARITYSGGTPDKDYGGYIHPHIDIDGSNCMGTYKQVVLDLLGRFRFEEAVLLINKYLNNYNPNDKYKEIRYWGKD